MIPSTAENNEYNQYIQQGAENATGNEDYSHISNKGQVQFLEMLI